MNEIKITAVSYLNTFPFVYGIQKSGFLEHYTLDLQVPSVCAEKLKKGMIIAIEPFATDGKGFIKESSRPTIFSQVSNRPVRDMTSRKVLAEIKNYNNLPFNYTWLSPKFSECETTRWPGMFARPPV